MKNIFFALLFISASLFFSSCHVGGHNEARLKPINENDERIYGDRNAPPRQLATQYPEDETGKTAARIDSIRTKLYPK